MAVSFFIPKKINVGFQERGGTYTGKLAYIIYFDEKGKLRKERSWEGWRDEKIDNQILDNEPMSGFVLNKRAGGYDTGWNHRQTYVRVYDPRGFEFEITVQNLLYILENATSTKGKGLEGDFVYGWDGKDLVLIPCDSPDWKELVKLNALRHSEKKIGARDIKIGATYRTRQNETWVYMGKHHTHGWNGTKSDKTKFWFYKRSETGGRFEQIGSVASKLVEVIDENSAEDYAEIFEKMEHNYVYSPIDESKTIYTPYTIEEVAEELDINGDSRWHSFYGFSNLQLNEGEMERKNIRYDSTRKQYYFSISRMVEREYGYGWSREKREVKESVNLFVDTLEEAFNAIKPHRKFKYLANGNLYGEVTY